MLIAVFFAGSGTLYLVFRRVPETGIVGIGIGGALVLGLLIWGAGEFNVATGIDAATVRSWQSLSGLSNPNFSAPCGDPVLFDDPFKAIAKVVGYLLALVVFVAGSAAFLGIPLGIMGIAWGLLVGLFTFKGRTLKWGVGTFVVGLGGLLLTGLLLRLMHFLVTGCTHGAIG